MSAGARAEGKVRVHRTRHCTIAVVRGFEIIVINIIIRSLPCELLAAHMMHERDAHALTWIT